MKLINYLQASFPADELIPSIYYQWDIGVHFSLGNNIYQFTDDDKLNPKRFELVYKQISLIFDELLDENDDLFLVTNVYKHKAYEKRTKKLRVYKRFLKRKSLLHKIQVKTSVYPFEIEEANEYEMQQFSLLCKRGDIRVKELLKAVSNEDFPLYPKLGGYAAGYPDVFFVNITKDIIFFVYDDRGCEVIALDAERIRPLSEKYYEWIEETK